VLARIRPLLVAVLVTIGALAKAADDPRNAWLIECKGGADAYGQVVFLFSEDKGAVTRIPVAIPNDTPENNVARRIRQELRQFLPKDDYDVDIDGGETVIVIALDPARRFEIRLQQNTVPGTEIIVVRERP
jgi:hypothetical protein